MRSLSLLILGTLTLAPACTQFEVTAQAGYALFEVDGDIGYTDDGSTVIAQDVESAFGLGDDQGTPYGRLGVDMGVPELTVSGFLFEDEGQGTLAADFGDISGGVEVNSELSITNAKAAYTLQIPIGPLTIAPGLAANYFDIDVAVATVLQGAASVDVQAEAPLPMAFLRAELDLDWVGLVAEVGYISIDVDDVDATLLDLEGLIEFRPANWVNLFAGYRMIDLDVQGIDDNERYDVDLQLGGLLVGGGFRF